MTVTSSNQDVSYSTDGSTTTFPIPFYFLQDGDITVDKIDGNGGLVTLVLGSDYTLTGAGLPEGGSLKTLSVIPVGFTLHVSRVVPVTQETVYQQNDAFPAKTTEKALDKLTMIAQQHESAITNSIRFPRNEYGRNGVLPHAAERASKIVSFDDAGNMVLTPMPASVGAGDLKNETWTADVDYVTGVSNSVPLSRAYGTKANLGTVVMAGIAQDPATYTLVSNNTVLQFNAPIPPGADRIWCVGGTTLSIYVPPDGSVTDEKLAAGSKVHNRAFNATAIDDPEYRAVGDGVTNNLTSVNAAIDATPVNRTLGVPPGAFLVGATPTNPYGVPFGVEGEVLLPDPLGGFQRLNSYADSHRISLGQEYLYRAYSRIKLGQGSRNGTLRTFIYGDSTVAGNNGETTPFRVENLLGRMFSERGIPNIIITNRAVSGTRVSDMNALPDVSATTDLFIIKYGINDGAPYNTTRLATFTNALRSKLTAIRAAAAVNALSIILVGPNATNDGPNGRDERWYETLRNVYVQAARDFQCAYFDTYAYMRDSRKAAGYWMDNPYGNGIAIHPLDHMNAWIWGAVFDTYFGGAETRQYATNSFTNAGSVSSSVSNSLAPSNYGAGITVLRATPANGWPEDGAVTTIKNVDAVTIQWLYPFANNRTRCLVRTAATGTDTWNRWSGVYENITLTIGWVAYGTPWAVPQACADGNGHVQLKGLIKSGTVAAGTVIATLPAGMIPAENNVFVCATNGGYCSIRVTATGNVEAQTAIDSTFTSLDSIRYQAA